jgi:hypothetical protein
LALNEKARFSTSLSACASLSITPTILKPRVLIFRF